MSETLAAALAARFLDAPDVAPALEGNPVLGTIAAHASCRSFRQERVEPDLVRALCAVALSSPTKSDLQQRDIVVVEDEALLADLKRLLSGQPWIENVPTLLVFCGNNRRQRQLHGWRDHAFVNDHLDAFFNAGVDAAIALSAFVIAAEAAGLGSCPISAIRNHIGEVSERLGLPDHVFPVAGLALGYPAAPPPISMRLPLRATVHTDRFDESAIEQDVAVYDDARHAARPYGTQRRADLYGDADPYTWSEDKARQYSLPERADFGRHIRKIGFKLD